MEFNWDEAITTPDLTFEQTTVSPHVHQFLTDYLFVRSKLIATGVEPTIDCGMGDADLALSIVNDAYNQEHVAAQIDNEIQIKNVVVAAEA